MSQTLTSSLFPLPLHLQLLLNKVLMTKLRPKRCHLVDGVQEIYDVDVRVPGEVQPQLEFKPFAKYQSDPGLVLGRRTAVNNMYICYALKGCGMIRVHKIYSTFTAQLMGLSLRRVVDMVFFAEDVHLLASASADGWIVVHDIGEGPDEQDNPQITGKVVVAVQFIGGEGESEYAHPRVCWHCHKREVLVVGIGNNVLKIDITKVERDSEGKPLSCSFDKLIEGVQLVGSHDGQVTDLSMCHSMTTTRLVSASVAGTVNKDLGRSQVTPHCSLRPYDGQPVNSVTFVPAPDRPDHIILITGGPLNREVKIWVSASDEGWLLPSDAESWNCTQTLEFKSSMGRSDEAFFNQVIALSQAGLLLLANAKRNAIYAVHLEYGPNPAAARMDYIAEFTVTTPILSFSGTSFSGPSFSGTGELLPCCEQIVEVYGVQTQAIQQYTLDLSQRVRSVMKEMPKQILTAAERRKQMAIRTNFSDVALLDDYLRNSDNNLSQDDSMALNHPIVFKHPTHLVTPSELRMANFAYEVSHASKPKIGDGDLNIQDVVISNNMKNVEVEVKVVRETRFSQNKEKGFCSQVSDLGIEMARGCRGLSPETYIVEDARQFDGTGENEIIAEPSTIAEIHDSGNYVSKEFIGLSTPMSAQQPPAQNAKGKKKKGKGALGSGSSSPSPSAFNSTDSFIEPGVSSSTPIESAFPQIFTMQEMLNQLVTMQKEMQMQMATMADAIRARFKEENAKQEKAERERTQQLTNMISNCLNKYLPAIIEKTVKREMTAVWQSVAQTTAPAIEKTITTSIVESFQETLKSNLEASMIPAFEMSCRAMFEQVDVAFQKGMVEHKPAAQQQFEASLIEILDGKKKLLALAAAGSNSKVANPLVSQLSNGLLGTLHEKLEVPLDPTKELSRLVAEGKIRGGFHCCPAKECCYYCFMVMLSGRIWYAFTFSGCPLLGTAGIALSIIRSLFDILISFLFDMFGVDLPGMLAMNSLPSSQGVLPSLVQQLACDISRDTSRKLTWMREILSAINPINPVIVIHVALFLSRSTRF
ncbi:hypothetical protein BUALT_Bualt18G0072000 [Buddleja alternifolia]|uniref:Enhancer of mRNA-decapping protein 4 WD40 repeat region domain-containing protein n=1 Tax=Buddleja alternifolia TaxID=168488 RepID=A0AAV6W268_9LAMI|nr:hypothetical protein BUALT_Bualt18G0072000 [Buddleja alternifolia]